MTDGLIRRAVTGDDDESGAGSEGGAGGERDDGVPQNKLSVARQGEQVLLRPRQGVPPPQHGETNEEGPSIDFGCVVRDLISTISITLGTELNSGSQVLEDVLHL